MSGRWSAVATALRTVSFNAKLAATGTGHKLQTAAEDSRHYTALNRHRIESSFANGLG
jgi:hypothetical protein